MADAGIVDGHPTRMTSLQIAPERSQSARRTRWSLSRTFRNEAPKRSAEAPDVLIGRSGRWWKPPWNRLIAAVPRLKTGTARP